MPSKLSIKFLNKHPLIAQIIWYNFSPVDFNCDEKLYRAFRKNDLDDDYEIKVNSISFPDPSFNWSRFSRPVDIRKRENGLKTDGCYSITVEQSRYHNMATPCHDPIRRNYSHTEVRQFLPNEDIFTEPPKGRKLSKQIEGWSKSQRLMYRENITYHLVREIEPTV